MFQTYLDSEGRVDVGLIEPNVVYARIAGGLSERVGSLYVAYVERALDECSEVHLFVDSSRLTHYDLVARSAFQRVVLDNRERFRSLAILTWTEGVSAAATAFDRAVGEALSIVTDASEFAHKLTSLVPDAPQKIARGMPLSQSSGSGGLEGL